MFDLLNRKIVYLFWVVVIIYSVSILLFYPRFIVDDAFIIFRYAFNFAHFGEMNWNVGCDPVEGYTGVLLPFIVGVCMKVGLDPIRIVHTVGILSFFLGGIFFYKLVKRISINRLTGIVFSVLYFIAPAYYTHIFSGLETVLFISLLILSSYTFFHCINNATKRNIILFSLTMLMLSFARPEGVLYSIFLILSLIYSFGKSIRGNFQNIILLILSYGIPACAYFLWRWNYYGFLLPNTSYVKSFNEKEVSKNLVNFLEYFQSYIIVLLMASAILAVFQLADKGKLNLPAEKQKRIFLFIPVSIFVLIVHLFYFKSDLAMNYSYRFFMHYYPLMLLMILPLFDSGMEAFKNTKLSKVVSRAIIALLVLLSGFQIFLNVYEIQKEFKFTSEYDAMLERLHIKAGKYIREKIPRDEWMVVCYDAGAIPFYSELKTIDFGGLNDENIPPMKRDNIAKVDYLFSFKPGVIVFTSYSDKMLHHSKLTADISRSDELKKYRLARIFYPQKGLEYYLYVYFRKDLMNDI